MKKTTNRQKLHRITGLFLSIFMLISVAGCGRANIQENQTAETQTVDAQAAEPSSETDTSFQQVVTTSDSTQVLTITCLKEGAADAFVLMTQDHVTIIDTGLEKKADKLVEFLTEQGVTKVDELIITHYDKDHVGGADHIIDEFEVGCVYTTYQSKESDDITSYLAALTNAGLSETVVTQEASFNAGDVSFTIYPPQSRAYMDSESNNSSLVIKVSLGENSMLFAGDAEGERIKELLATSDLQSTILKVPHHGRLAANTAQLVEYVDPDYAIITSGNSETEDQEVLDILSENGVETYLTKNGNITITLTADSVNIVQ